jgi:branched-chain amino acid transport system permease protein
MMNSLPSTLHTRYGEEVRLLDSGFTRFWCVVGVLFALALPWILSSYGTGVANQAFIAVVGALALNLLMGVTGQISLGHAGFLAAGAFISAALVSHFNAPIGISLICAMAGGAIIGVLVGLPALRLKGLYLAVSTLAAHFVIIVALGQYQNFASDGAGFTMPPPSLAGLSVSTERQWFYVLLPISLLVLLVQINWLRSAFGRAWMAIHHRDISAEVLGVNVARYKLLAFSASTSLTCLCGALGAYHTGFVSVEAYDVHLLIQYLAMVIIGGLGSMLGSILGAIFVISVPHIITAATNAFPVLQGLGSSVFEIQIGLFGVIMLLFLVLEPRGLTGIWMRIRAYFELWPFKFRAWES